MRRFLPLVIIVFIVASISIYLFGDSGVVALRTMERYKRSLSANVDALRQRNAELTAQLAQLQSDPENNRILARSVDMYGPDEAVIKLEGRRSPAVAYAMGDLIRMKRSDGGSTVVLKAVAAALVLLLGAFAFLDARKPRGRANDSGGR
jgi:cell division protein FtsB